MNSNVKLIIIGIITLAIGLAGGYYYGDLTGKNIGLEDGIAQGRQQVLDEQEKQRQEELAKLAEEANVFNDIEDAANPFKDAYKNPFAQ
ncbi:MAG: hypothetical protein ABIJ28_01360 [Patescibacteria group bacterium]